MKTAKFGGSSLASSEQIRKVCDIITADTARRLVIVSAPGKRTSQDTKVTDLLIEAAEARLTHREGTAQMERVEERFVEISDGLGLATADVDPIVDDLR